MSVDSLLDTNVIIYLLDESHPEKYQCAEKLVESALQSRECCISPQVVQETLNVATRKLGFSQTDANRLLDQILLPLCRNLPINQLYQRGLDIKFRYQYSFYDALIIAAALETGCKTLFSEDLQHGHTIEQLMIVNPFL